MTRRVVPKHVRCLVRDLDAMGDGTGRSLVLALAQAQVWEPFFQIVRWREREGIYQLEHDDHYVLAMINALGGGMDAGVLNAALREDEELRQTTFWRIFEVHGSQRVNLAYLDRYRDEPGQGWESSILTLVGGTLPRGRVAGACKQVLARNFPNTQAAWFARLRTKVR